MSNTQPPLNLIDISARLRHLMDSNNLTIAELATKADVSKSAMEKYLAGPSSPRGTAIAAICTSFDVSADWLLFGKPQDEFQTLLLTLRSEALHVIWALISELKQSPELSTTFSSLDYGSEEWRKFIRDLAYSRTMELLRNFVKAHEEGGIVIGQPIEIPMPGSDKT